MTHPLLTQDHIDAYARDGVVLVKGLFKDQVEELRAGVARNMAEPGPYAAENLKEGEGGRFFDDYCNWTRIPEFQAAIKASPAAAVAAELMGSKTVQMFHDHVLVKEPGSSFPTPWHQDQPYYFVEAKQTVSFWVPLDEVKRENCVQYVKGSHKADGLYRPERFNGDALIENDTRQAVPDIANNPDQFPILGWDVKPGDAIAFDFRTLHGAAGNNASTRRRAISFRLVGDEARV